MKWTQFWLLASTAWLAPHTPPWFGIAFGLYALVMGIFISRSELKD